MFEWTEWTESFSDGYKDGVSFHMYLDFEAKDDDRYCSDNEYARGFDRAGDDS